MFEFAWFEFTWFELSQVKSSACPIKPIPRTLVSTTSGGGHRLQYLCTGLTGLAP